MAEPGTRVDAVAATAAVAAVVGAVAARPLPAVLGPLVVVVARLLGRRLPTGVAVAALGLGVALLASSLGARAEAGLVPPPVSRWSGTATLVSDPDPVGVAIRMVVRVEGRLLEAWASGPVAWALEDRLAGERIQVAGTTGPLPGHAHWLRHRHVVGRLGIDRLDGWEPGHPASRVANGLRRTLVEGAAPLGRETRSLYVGLLLGDRRDQDPLLTDAFRGAGLTHLMAVSGQNVAFVVALVAPLLRRLRLVARLPATLALLGFFALLTRFEPSVLRATTMAGAAALATTLGRPAPTRRLLAVAVTVVVLVDPLIVRALAFQLSVAATAGILAVGGRVAGALPGPRPLAAAVGVTTGAQIGVAPLLVPVFGGLPVASLPANLAAGPVAGPVVVWGIPAGLLAGWLGPPVDAVLHRPTAVLVGWIGRVAETTASWPLGELRVPHLAVGTAGAVAVAARRALGPGRGRRPLALLGWAAVVAALVHPALALRATPVDGAVVVADHAVLHRSGGAGILVLDGPVGAGRVLEGLRRAGVGRLDVVVVDRGDRAAAELVVAVAARHRPRAVLAPVGHRVPGASVPPVDGRLSVGSLVVEVDEVAPRLRVRVGARPGPAAASGVGSGRAPAPRRPPLRHHPPGVGHGHPQPHAGLLLRPRGVLGVRRLPRQGRAAGGRRGRLPRRRRRQGRSR